VTRAGKDAPPKTEHAVREVEILDRDVLAMLRAHRLASLHSGDSDYVFATATGRPINARNLVTRMLYLGRLRKHDAFDFPHRDFDVHDLRARVEAAGLSVQLTETFRFAAPRGLGQGLLNRLDALLPQHGFGDILALVVEKPAASGKVHAQ
jgi:hypothetical protein